MVLKGDIDEIRFRNDENGYTILALDANGESVVCVGTFPPVTEGESVEVTGDYVLHPRFGRQFKAAEVKTYTPDSEDAVIRFLGSGVIKGLGPKTALSIVSKFGKETLKILEFAPHKLAKIRGVGPNKAAALGAEYGQVRAMREAVMFLQKLGVSLNLAFKIYKAYGSETAAVVKTNPYVLIEDIDGVGFLTADKIAAESGIGKDSAFRVQAGIIYTLKESSDKNGNTYLPKDEAVPAAARLLGVAEERVKEEIEHLFLSRKLKAVPQYGDDGIMLAALYRVEKTAAQKLAEMLNAANTLKRDPTSLIDEFERAERIYLHKTQRDAVNAAANSGVSVITGGPGTGKTTIIKCILKVFSAWGIKSMLMAPTGRAAKRISDHTGEAASTIHRALMSACGEPFPTNAVIVDEVSMVDVFLLNALLSRLKPDTRLILVGDKDQLPSVGAGNVLADILSSGLFNVTELNHVYRQDGQSMIVTAAHQINGGVMPDLSVRDRDFFFVEGKTPEEAADKTVGLISERLPAYLNLPASKIQILCPMKNGPAGTHRLNERLADIINENRDKREVFSDGERLRVGDKVMHIANNYELCWRKDNGRFGETGEGVFNGDAGIIESVNPESGELAVLFEDGRYAIYTPDIRSQLVLSYAITVHKSQGSEFDAVIIPIVPGSPVILTRNLLYTAITRARRLVVLVGQRYNIKRMVDNNYVQKRYSYLKPFMTEAVEKAGLLYGDE